MGVLHENPQVQLSIYRRLPFSQRILYQAINGGGIDLTGKKAELVLRPSPESVDVLYTFSTVNGKITMGFGVIEIGGMTKEETAALVWDQAVGHLVVEEIVGKPLPIAYFLFNVYWSSTGVPL